MKEIRVLLDDADHAKLKELAAEDVRTLASLVKKIIVKFIDSKKEN